MTPYEILLSESQERMLFVIKPGHEKEALAILDKWGLDAAIIGEVVEEPNVRIQFEGKEVVNLPIIPVVDGALDLKRPAKRPEYLDEVVHINLTEFPRLFTWRYRFKKTSSLSQYRQQGMGLRAIRPHGASEYASFARLRCGCHAHQGY